jgi:hypothetical protein
MSKKKVKPQIAFSANLDEMQGDARRALLNANQVAEAKEMDKRYLAKNTRDVKQVLDLLNEYVVVNRSVE